MSTETSARPRRKTAQLRKATPAYNLAALHPDIADMWSPANPVPASEVHPGTQEAYEFVCDNGPDHVWVAAVKSLTKTKNPTGCPACANQQLSVTNRLDTQYADIAEEWHPTKNIAAACDFVYGSGHNAWWICPKGHEYQQLIHRRTQKNRDCSTCRIQERSIASKCPKLVPQWHPTKNGDLTPQIVAAGSTAQVWWKCSKAHEWQATPDNRRRRNGNTRCPDCSHLRVSDEFNLAVTHQAIAQEYHPTLNTVPAHLVHPGSEVPRYWVCADNPAHVWRAQPLARTRTRAATGCPVCNLGGWTPAAVAATLASLIAEGSLIDELDSTERAVIFHTLGLTSVSDSTTRAQLAKFVSNHITIADLHLACGGDQEEYDRVRAIRAARDLDEGVLADDDTADGGPDAGSGELPAMGVEAGGPFATDGGAVAAAILEPLTSALVAAVTGEGQALDTLLHTRVDKMWRAVSAMNAAEQADFVAAAAARRTPAGAPAGAVDLAARVADLFCDEYSSVETLTLPATWSSAKTPSQMQRLTAVRLGARRRIANWSGTGAGKTLSAVLSAGVLDADVTVVACPNAVVGNWVAEILEAYPTAQVLTKTLTPSFPQALPGHTPMRFLVINFEQLQQPTSRARVEHLLATYPPAFVVIDELHNVKQRGGTSTVSRRKELIGELLTTATGLRPECALLAMTATPVLNDLHEARSLVELVTGQELPELGTRATVGNAYAVYAALAKVGLRLSGKREPYQIVEVEVDSSDALEEVLAIGPLATVLDVDRTLTKIRMPAIIDAIAGADTPSLVYTHYVDGIVPMLVSELREAGFTVGEFTGENKSGLEEFTAGRLQVLVASAPISTGVDGLQYVSTNLVVNCPPWTWSETEQLIGRLARQGQPNGEVTVTIPVASADLGDQQWSWDANRLARLQFKRQLAEAAVDGTVAEEHEVSASQVLGVLKAQLAKAATEGAFRVVHPATRSTLVPRVHGREDLVGPRREYSAFSKMNAKLNRSHSTTTHRAFTVAPGEFYGYHDSYDARSPHWDFRPVEAAAAMLANTAGLTIGDFGCGPKAQLADAVGDRNIVHSFDHVAAEENITACDMASVPLADGELDVAVFSLSLMGSNAADYLREAHRVLAGGGTLLVWEAAARIRSFARLRAELDLLGFDEVVVESAGKFTHVRAIRADRGVPTWAPLTLGGKDALSVVA